MVTRTVFGAQQTTKPLTTMISIFAAFDFDLAAALWTRPIWQRRLSDMNIAVGEKKERHTMKYFWK